MKTLMVANEIDSSHQKQVPCGSPLEQVGNKTLMPKRVLIS